MISKDAEIIDFNILNDESFTFIYDVKEEVIIKKKSAERFMAKRGL